MESQIVLDAYPIHVETVRPLSGGNMSTVWHVLAREGEFVLRRLDDDSHNRAGTRHRFLEFLAKRFAGNTPAPVRTKSGESVLAMASALVELLTYVPGHVPISPAEVDFRDSQCLTATAELLATFHRAAADFPTEGEFWWHPPNFKLSQDDVLLGLSLTLAEPAADLMQRSRQLVDLLEATDLSLIGFREQPIHNDFAWYNLTFQRGKPTGIIDFDRLTVSARIVDVAYAAYASVPVGPSLSEGSEAWARGSARYAAFLNAYHDVNPLDSNERAAIPMLMRLQIEHGVRQVVGGHLAGDHRSTRILSHAVDGLDWLAWFEGVRRDIEVW